MAGAAMPLLVPLGRTGRCTQQWLALVQGVRRLVPHRASVSVLDGIQALRRLLLVSVAASVPAICPSHRNSIIATFVTSLLSQSYTAR